MCAFAQANKISDAAPRTKIAVIERAYRKPPKNGICPSPEPAWGDTPWEVLQLLERLPSFFYVQCKPFYEAHVEPQSRDAFMANVDVSAADAFFAAFRSQQPSRLKHAPITKALLDATVKYAEQIGCNADPS